MNWPRWMRPSLGRRLLLALLIATGLVTLALLTQQYIGYRQSMQSAPGVQQLGRILLAGVETLEQPAQAIVGLQGQLGEVNQMRREAKLLPGDLLLQLFDSQGHLLWTSAPAPAVTQAGISEPQLGQQRYWAARLDGKRWSLVLAEPRLPDQDVLSWLARELSESLLIAFPLILLPMWLAVHRGLAPLRQLVRRIARLDGEAALQPLGLDLRYTELQPLGRAFESLQQRLRRLLARERAFVHDAAHELRTPLATLAAQAHLLEQADSPEARSAAAQALQLTLKRTAHLSQQLLDLAALDQQAGGRRETLDLVELLGRHLIEALPRAKARGLELSLQAPDQLSVTLESAALQSIVQNLIDNALAYVPAGGHIELTLAVRGDGVELRVADDGPGIAAEERERVFERFHRGAGQQQPGSGLGLAIVRQAALRLGAQLHLSDGLAGRGVGFVLRLPPQVLQVPPAATAFGES
ncbi:ATP-binding protein [Paucibacter sp. APW11]|uniref:histidine kinase n=1 Tax=Roseateles aquae TaxID=3077235 RepID=A0ABU3PEA0_9BURK|nr:ATP-binding protein [Paucibacter sp. APW11]MDT9000869.1 ATP-binding protein [Paucibacter sp. APW11]